MKIKEAIKQGVRRVYSPIWAEKNAYMRLPKMIDGKYGPWIQFFSDETQELLGFPTPQDILISMLVHGENSDCEPYLGPISPFDEESIMEWQPIETAPKDGTPILIYDSSELDDPIYVVRYSLDEWREACGECYYTWNPTHWMPLPNKPKKI
jgi:hypothetical protein